MPEYLGDIPLEQRLDTIVQQTSPDNEDELFANPAARLRSQLYKITSALGEKFPTFAVVDGDKVQDEPLMCIGPVTARGDERVFIDPAADMRLAVGVTGTHVIREALRSATNREYTSYAAHAVAHLWAYALTERGKLAKQKNSTPHQ